MTWAAVAEIGKMVGVAQVIGGFLWGNFEDSVRGNKRPRPGLVVRGEDYQLRRGCMSIFWGFDWLLTAGFAAMFFIPVYPAYAAYRGAKCWNLGARRIMGRTDPEPPALPDGSAPALETEDAPKGRMHPLSPRNPRGINQ